MSPSSEYGGYLEASSHARGLHSPQLVLEVLDLIPDPGGHLELQLGRGGMHLIGELTDQRDQVTTRLAAAGRALARRAGRGRAGARGQPRHRSLAAALL